MSAPTWIYLGNGEWRIAGKGKDKRLVETRAQTYHMLEGKVVLVGRGSRWPGYVSLLALRTLVRLDQVSCLRDMLRGLPRRLWLALLRHCEYSSVLVAAQ